MNLGKMLGFASPLAGMITGNGAGLLPFLSPGFGMLTGKGPFGHILGGGHHDQQDQSQQGQMPGLDPEQLQAMLNGGVGGYGGGTFGGFRPGMFGAGFGGAR